MSWDVLVFDFKGPPPELDKVPKDYRVPPIGEASEVRDKISTYLPQVEWSTPIYGTYLGEGFVIEFNLLKDDVLDSFGLRVLGRGDAIAAIMQFARPTGWSIYDCSMGDFLDHDNPSESGWRGFQEYRDRVLGRTSEIDEAW